MYHGVIYVWVAQNNEQIHFLFVVVVFVLCSLYVDIHTLRQSIFFPWLILRPALKMGLNLPEQMQVICNVENDRYGIHFLLELEQGVYFDVTSKVTSEGRFSCVCKAVCSPQSADNLVQERIARLPAHDCFVTHQNWL